MEHRAENNTEKVILKYSHMVYRLAFAKVQNKSDAEDIYQEVFLRYLRKKPEFQSEEHQKAWFLRVTINCANTLLISPWRKRREIREEEAEIGFMPSQEEETLLAELQKLPQKYKEVLHLFYYEDLPIKEIAGILHLRESNVRARLTRARAKLKEQLWEEEECFKKITNA